MPSIQTSGYSSPTSVEKKIGNLKYGWITVDCIRDVGSAQTIFHCLNMQH